MPKRVKLVFPYPAWPIMRQTPQLAGQWGDYQFYLNDETVECDYLVVFENLLKDADTAICAPENTLFIAAEYSVRKYDERFLKQFQHVLTCQTEMKHPHVTQSVPGNPWFVGKSYDELKQIREVVKSKKISVISSNKKYIPGHNKRLAFVTAIKDYFGDAVDFFGRGIRGFEDKWDVVAPYQYSIAIENDLADNYMTEKLFDCFLAHTVPLYYGASNAESYFPNESLIRIDLDDIDGAKELIRKLLNSDNSDKEYNRRVDALIEAKHVCLDQLQLFPLIVNFIESHGIAQSAKRKLTIRKEFQPSTAKQFSLLPRRIARRLWRTAKTLINPPQQTQRAEHIAWFKDNGDQTHRVNYDLNYNSVVFDLGGYQGMWTSDIALRYSPTVHVFEPNPAYAAQIRTRFGENKRVHVYTFGLAKTTETATLSIAGDRTSLFTNGEDQVKIQLMGAADFFREHHIGDIDLMKINIEGGEYDLLEHLIEEKLTPRIRHIQVQFHDFVPNAQARMEKIQAHLSQTHELTYQYRFVWENWTLKKQDHLEKSIQII